MLHLGSRLSPQSDTAWGGDKLLALLSEREHGAESSLASAAARAAYLDETLLAMKLQYVVETHSAVAPAWPGRSSVTRRHLNQPQGTLHAHLRSTCEPPTRAERGSGSREVGYDCLPCAHHHEHIVWVASRMRGAG